MSLSIVSDGTAIGTKVYYNDEDITNQITGVTWGVEARSSAWATVDFKNVQLALDKSPNVQIQVGNVRVNYQMFNMRRAVRHLFTLCRRPKCLPGLSG